MQLTPEEGPQGRSVSPSDWEPWGRATSLLPDWGSQDRARPPSSDSQEPFQGVQPPLCTPSPPLTCLSRQDPFVEPMFT